MYREHYIESRKFDKGMLQDRSILREFIGYSIIVRMLVFKLYTFDLDQIGFCKNCRGQG